MIGFTSYSKTKEKTVMCTGKPHFQFNLLLFNDFRRKTHFDPHNRNTDSSPNTKRQMQMKNN